MEPEVTGLEIEIQEGVLALTLNRPKVNALNQPLLAALQAAFQNAGDDGRVRCVLLRASGAVFSAGQDIPELAATLGMDIQSHIQRSYNPLVLQIRRLEKPVLAAVQGAVSGAALGLVLACDLRIASEAARFVVGFLNLGLVPDSAVSVLLPALIGLGRASELAFTNRSLGAADALAFGLVNRLAPSAELSAQALAWAAELSRGPAGAMGLTKRTFNRAIPPHLESVLNYEAELQQQAAQGREHQEGVHAFLEKRAPDFPGA